MKVAQLVGDRSEAHVIFAGYASLQNPNAFVTQLVLQALLHLASELAPLSAGVPDFTFSVVQE